MSKRGGGKFTSASNLEQQRRFQSAPVTSWTLQWTIPSSSGSSLTAAVPGGSQSQGLKVLKYVKTSHRATFESLEGGVVEGDAMDVDLEDIVDDDGDEGEGEGDGDGDGDGEGGEDGVDGEEEGDGEGETKEEEPTAELNDGKASDAVDGGTKTTAANPLTTTTTDSTSVVATAAASASSLGAIVDDDIDMDSRPTSAPPPDALPVASSSRIPAGSESINIPSPSPIPTAQLSAATSVSEFDTPENEAHTHSHIPANAIQGSIATAVNSQFGGTVEAGEMEIIGGESQVDDAGVFASLHDLPAPAEFLDDSFIQPTEGPFVFDPNEGDGEGGERVDLPDEGQERVEMEGMDGVPGVGPIAGEGMEMDP